MSGHQLVVAGEDLHVHSVGAETLDRFGDALKQMIGKGQKARERQIALIGRLEAERTRDLLGSYGEDAKPLLAQHPGRLARGWRRRAGS